MMSLSQLPKFAHNPQGQRENRIMQLLPVTQMLYIGNSAYTQCISMVTRL